VRPKDVGARAKPGRDGMGIGRRSGRLVSNQAAEALALVLTPPLVGLGREADHGREEVPQMTEPSHNPGLNRAPIRATSQT